jgi:hypothetical protein
MRDYSNLVQMNDVIDRSEGTKLRGLGNDSGAWKAMRTPTKCRKEYAGTNTNMRGQLILDPSAPSRTTSPQG